MVLPTQHPLPLLPLRALQFSSEEAALRVSQYAGLCRSPPSTHKIPPDPGRAHQHFLLPGHYDWFRVSTWPGGTHEAQLWGFCWDLWDREALASTGVSNKLGLLGSGARYQLHFATLGGT